MGMAWHQWHIDISPRHILYHLMVKTWLVLIASRISWICWVSAGAQGQASGAFCFLNVGTMPVSPMYPGPWQGHKSDSSRQDPPRGIQLTVRQAIQKHTETAASAAWSNHVAAKWNRDSSGLKEMMTITCGHLLWPITARAINKYTGQSVISVIKLQTVQGITCSASAHTMLPVGSHVLTSCQAETHKALKWCPWVLHLQWLSLTLVFCVQALYFLSRWWTCYFLNNLQWYAGCLRLQTTHSSNNVREVRPAKQCPKGVQIQCYPSLKTSVLSFWLSKHFQPLGIPKLHQTNMPRVLGWYTLKPLFWSTWNHT